jgi:aryl-alcohol dehydrogenase-like predicted oxidoreductase
MLTALKKEGLIQEIGVTNFDTIRLKELVEAGVPVVSNQVQFSLLDQRPERSGMRAYCAAKGIQIIAFGTVGAGLLSERFLGASPPVGPALDGGGVSLRMYLGTAQRAGGWAHLQKLLGVLDPIAKKNGVAIANVAQRYLLELPGVGCVLIGVRNSQHIIENAQTYSFALDDGDKAKIAAVIAEAPGPKGDVWDLERGYI